jgi:ornithine lipid hydroxylase
MIRWVARYLAFPLLLGGGVALAFGSTRLGLKPLAAANALSLLMFAAVFGLERLIPLDPKLNARDGQALKDIGHSIVGTAAGAWVGNRLVDLSFNSLGLWAASLLGFNLWPTGLPLAVQGVMIFLLCDLGRYVQHRLLHGVPLFWRFHALHHDAEHLTALKASRSHIVERITQQLFMFGPAVMLGAPPEVLLLYIVPNTFLGPFSHSNTDIRIGFFEYLFQGPRSHRLHHSLDLKEGNSNFGSALCVWDMVFGTYLYPLNRPPPARTGVTDPQPTGFLAQILAPFGFRSAPANPDPSTAPR